MESTSSPTSNTRHQNEDDGEEVTQKLFTIQSSDKPGKLEQKPVKTTTEDIEDLQESSNDIPESIKKLQKDSSETIEKLDTADIPAADYFIVKDKPPEITDTLRLPAQAEIEIIQDT